jgi:acetylornithine deacetylase/succinyl-diaminopimelate desuccinylase-like protein
VSDNKGPILAAAFAISELRRKVALGLDVVMLIEGEEEAGSRGFEEIVQRHKVEFLNSPRHSSLTLVALGCHRAHRRHSH